MRMHAMIGILAAALAAGSVVNLEKTPQPPVSAAQKTGKAAPANAPASAGSVSGTIVETMDSGGYTYMKLKTGAGDIWCAVNQAKVRKGQTVTVATPMLMENFESKTLHRKFDRILFGTLAEPGAGPAALPPGHPAVSEGSGRTGMAAQHAAAANPPALPDAIKVPKAEGATGKTIAELFAQRVSLKEKEVAVRGQVIKVTPEVMGKNWLHLRDGSGSHEKKDDDITVTTTGKADVGQIILVKGILRVDRDFGAGYSYPVIIEDAKLSK